jgi:hypothetical protein
MARSLTTEWVKIQAGHGAGLLSINFSLAEGPTCLNEYMKLKHQSRNRWSSVSPNVAHSFSGAARLSGLSPKEYETQYYGIHRHLRRWRAER